MLSARYETTLTSRTGEVQRKFQNDKVAELGGDERAQEAGRVVVSGRGEQQGQEIGQKPIEQFLAARLGLLFAAQRPSKVKQTSCGMDHDDGVTLRERQEQRDRCWGRRPVADA